MPHIWPRRDWLFYHATVGAALVIPRTSIRQSSGSVWTERRRVHTLEQTSRVHLQAAPLEPDPLQAVALAAIDAARTAGAHYADARLTRTVTHVYRVGKATNFLWDFEEVGVGVRALVNGYWGFAASPFRTPDAAVQLARNATAQATVNAKGPPRVVDFGTIPQATGVWSTPMAIDPWSISIEEKLDFGDYWYECAIKSGLKDLSNAQAGGQMVFERQERILATTEGTLVTQTQSVSGAKLGGSIKNQTIDGRLRLHAVDFAGGGWEIFLNNQLPDRIAQMGEDARRFEAAGQHPFTVGRYTVVCDGRTMASLLDATLGLATQLDRALGYEANATGTSFIDDPLAMIGTAAVAAPSVTVTANRSRPGELATVRWDEEGVAPEPFTLVKDGVLVDFQTTREQAGWLAPYYERHGQPVRSHGCAAAEDAHRITLQHTPNLSLEPNPAPVRLDDLVADVRDGILIEDGFAFGVDWQERGGLLTGNMRQITNGKVGALLTGAASVMFNTADVWKHLRAIGGVSTQATRAIMRGFGAVDKGEPPQQTSHSVRAVAATIPNQPVINLERKA